MQIQAGAAVAQRANLGSNSLAQQMLRKTLAPVALQTSSPGEQQGWARGADLADSCYTHIVNWRVQLCPWSSLFTHREDLHPDFLGVSTVS